MSYYNEDTVKEIKAEERAYSQWENNLKNHILSIANTGRKQTLWALYFPKKEEPNDDYLEGLIF